MKGEAEEQGELRNNGEGEGGTAAAFLFFFLFFPSKEKERNEKGRRRRAMRRQSVSWRGRISKQRDVPVAKPSNRSSYLPPGDNTLPHSLPCGR